MADPTSSLRLHVLDVGHGDSLVLEFPNRNSFAIIDCNQHVESHRGFGESFDPMEPKALTYFRHLVAKGVSPVVEFACLTHPHLDHYRGYGALLMGLQNLRIPVREFWDFGVAAKKAKALRRLPDVSAFRERRDEMVKLLQIEYALIKQGMDRMILTNPTKALWSDCDVEIDLLAPHANQFDTYANYLECETTEEKQQYRSSVEMSRTCFTDPSRPCKCACDDNVVCSALLVKYGKCRLLLAGDVTNCCWRGILDRCSRLDPRCGCVKVSHHGSVEGNFPNHKRDLWEVLNADGGKLVAVISGGYRRDLPHGKTLASLALAGCDIYCTGPGAQMTLCSYVPPDYPLALIAELMPTVFFVEKATSTPPQSFPGAYGNVIVECSENGDCQVYPEFSRLVGT